MWNPRNLPDERPSSMDEKGKRVFIQPAKVQGFFKKWRTLFYLFLTFVFMVLPWTRFAGEQTILLDLANRRFTFFGMTFWAHDGPLIFFPLIIALMTLVFVSSRWGRLWCGWACPQTVFIDLIYRRIEEWIEGNHVKRMQLNKQPMNTKKFMIKLIKWLLFFVVSSHIAHSVTAYFVGARQLIWISTHSPFDNFGLFIFVQVFTVILLFDFGWFREQFCIIMCPYGRFQSVLMDENSMAVMYDESRGEPRGKAKKLEEIPKGDCIDCYKCVSVCPTGIDIRKGVQLECIACTACIDACDEVMEKINKPKGLIRYSSLNLMTKNLKQWSKRTFIYLFALIALIALFVYTVSTRKNYELKVLRAIDAPYKITQSEKGPLITNHFKMHYLNQSQAKTILKVLQSKLSDVEVIVPTLPMSIEPGKDSWVHFFVRFSQSLLKEEKSKSMPLLLKIENDALDSNSIDLEVNLIGP